MRESSEKVMLLEKNKSNSLGEKIDRLIALFKMAFADRIDKHKNESLKRSEVKRKIYEACKRKPQNRQELAQIIRKSPDYVSSYLTLMTREGILTTEQKDDETYYVAFV
jgi:hypothetical protein